jgi:hypothetical protein
MVMALVCIAVAGVALAWVLDRNGQAVRPMTTTAVEAAETESTTTADDRWYVYNHKDELDGYLRPTPWGWRAMVQACPTNPPKGWRQGCGWVRAGKAVRVGNSYRIYRRGRVVGTARGSDAVDVVAYELINKFDHEQYWKDGE